MSLVSILTTGLSGKNSLATTFIVVYSGIAMIIPNMPNKNPLAKITINISSGCEFTLFEKIRGEVILLSINCAAQYPMKTYSVVEIISPCVSGPILPNRVSIITKAEEISGPIYGMILSNAVINAIMNAFSTPKISKTIR